MCARATLALQPDFGVFLGCLWLVLRGTQLPSDMQYRFLVLQHRPSTHATLLSVSSSELPRTDSRKGARNTPKSGCSASVALAHTRTPLSRYTHLRTTCRRKHTSNLAWRSSSHKQSGGKSHLSSAVSSSMPVASPKSACSRGTTRWARWSR